MKIKKGLDEIQVQDYTQNMKKMAAKKPRHAKSDKPLEFERDWQDLQFQYDKMNVDWTQLATQVDILSDSDSFLAR